MSRSPFMGVFRRVAAAAMLIASPALAQSTGIIKGTVVDSGSRRPVEGAQIVVSGTSLGALSNAEGAYIIRGVLPGNHTVRMTRIGMQATQRVVRVTAGQESVADFVARPFAISLSQVVVTGYGTAARKEVTNSIASVRSEDVANNPIASIDAALQGKAAGLQVIQNAGNPGNGMSVRIRGSSSLSATNQPLYVIDGVPMLQQDFSQLSLGGQGVSAVSGLSANEIASIDVLKDASAAAIYGSRASNGVVLITTKRGQANRSRITFNGYTGFQDLERKVGLLNGKEYVAYMAEAMRNDGYSEDEINEQGFKVGVNDTINTDWQDAVLQTAPVSDATLSMSGGSDRTTYYLSGSYFNQKGIQLGSQYNRQNIRSNLDFAPNSRLSLRGSIGMIREDNDRTENDNTVDGVATNALALQPNIGVRKSDGSFTSTDDGLWYTSPTALGTFDAAESRTLRGMGNVEAQYTFSDRLRWTSKVGMDMLSLRDLRWQSPKVIGTFAASTRGIAQQGTTSVSRLTSQSFLQFEVPEKKYGSFSIVAGGEAEYNTQESDFIQGEGFANEAFRYVGNAGKVTSYNGGRVDNNLISAFSRANWSLKDRYFLASSVRIDGSSRFGEDNKYGRFSSASVGWQVSDEAFMSWLRRHSVDLKLRLSYGETGNQGINDNYAPLARFGRANYSDEPGLGPATLGNPALKWESTREKNLGFDLSFLSGRVGLVGDIFNKKTNDLLVSRPITSTSGYTSIFANIGNIQNKGWELALNTENYAQDKKDGFRWSSDFNISHISNKVTALYNGEPFNTGIRSINRVEVGQPIGAFHTLRFIGVDPQTGNAKYDDVNKDGVVNSLDRVIVGSPHPDYFGGIGNTMSWMGFDLRAFVQFSQGAEVFNAVRIFSDDGGYNFDNKYRDGYTGRWQKAGDIATDPRLSFDGTSGARDVSSRFIEDGSYFRLQEVTLGYRMPTRLANLMNMSEGRLFVTGRNLYTWTDYFGYNPDVNSNGLNTNISLGTDFYAYPLARTISFGIRGTW